MTRKTSTSPTPVPPAPPVNKANAKPSAAQRSWLLRGLTQPGGKLPLFSTDGKRVSERTVKTCLQRGWVEPWFANPVKPDWQICKLTRSGMDLLSKKQ